MKQTAEGSQPALDQREQGSGGIDGVRRRWTAGPLAAGSAIVTRLTGVLSIPIARTSMIIAAVFVIDCLTPLGIESAALYMAAVLSAVPMHRRRAIHITAAVCSVLVFIGWIISPGHGETEWWKVLINRSVDLGAIWAAAGMADVWKRFQEDKLKQTLASRLLHQAAALSAAQLSFRDALQSSLKTLCDIVGWPAAHVYVSDGSGQFVAATSIWHVAETGRFELLQVAARGLRFSQGESAVGRVWMTGESTAVEKVAESPGYSWLKDPERLGVVGAFLLPVTVAGKVVAVMEFFSERPIRVDAEFGPLARSVGEQLGRLFERRKAEQALRQSEERLRLALQGGRMGTWEWQMDTGQVIWSPELAEIHGLRPGTFEGTLEAMQRRTHPEDRDRVTAAVEQALGEGGDWHVEYRIIRPDGSIQWLESRGAVHTEPDGQARRLVGVSMNVTERKQFEEQNARLAAIVQSSDDAILSKSLDGTVLNWNAGAERIYGYRAEEIVGKSISILSADDREDELPEIMERISCGQRVDHYETVRKRKDGQLIDIWLSVSPIRNTEGVVVAACSVARDITERKRAERAMQESREKAETANRMQSRFLANMSHELRTPMNSILGMLQLALSGEAAPELRGWLNTAKSSAESLLVLLNDLLDLSKIEAGRLTVESEPFCLSETLDETLRALAPKAFEAGLELVCDVDHDVPDGLVGDAFRLRQVLTNLVANAVKFTQRGEVVVAVKQEPGANGHVIQFSVTDTGVGIADDEQHRIFEPFVQSDATAERRQGGAGLGLPICRELVRRMGGELNVTSMVGQGSRFWFSLPFGIAQETVSDESPHEDARQLQGMPVLVVDKNAACREALTKMLGRWGMIPDMGVDYDHALGKLYRAEIEGEKYRLMIIDDEAAGMTGGMLPARLAESLDAVPAIVLLTHPGKDHVDEGDAADLAAPVSLEKPVSPSRLWRTVQRALGWRYAAADKTPRSPLRHAALMELRVLVAEDTPANQQVVKSVLSRRGHRVTVVGDGAEAVSALDRQEFDVVLMDVTMPVLDGLEATRAIREREKGGLRRVPIVGLTAHAMHGIREDCAAAGMDACLVKPFDVCELVEVVEDLARSRILAGQVDRPATGSHAESATARIVVDDPLVSSDTEAGSSGEAVIDYRGVLGRLGGDEGLFRDIVRLFDQDAPGLLQTIRTSLAEAEAAELQRAAHSLRGLAANFGAKDAVDRAIRLERLGESGRLDDAAEALEELEWEITRLNRTLSSFRESDTAPSA
ncbi:MAG: PAS domain S-box protein [Planctomycetaceae bacterium]|nr:PAS domain S-box protein [Planctomycetaceae bacterium]